MIISYLSIAVLILLVIVIYLCVKVDRLENIQKDLLRRYDYLENKAYLIRDNY